MQVHSYKYSGLVRATAPLPLLSLSVRWRRSFGTPGALARCGVGGSRKRWLTPLCAGAVGPPQANDKVVGVDESSEGKGCVLSLKTTKAENAGK
jgi:hypothetical protein|eukprot:COSAG06_NODE_4464_length_4229_cov_2.660291_6_plen_94_part_00